MLAGGNMSKYRAKQLLEAGGGEETAEKQLLTQENKKKRLDWANAVKYRKKRCFQTKNIFFRETK